ncbi:MAG: hypothetical protein LBE16_07460 [Clostridiales Family XIII bacterium]|nr:hypothetical protein [Clostridiales Family XIII bacterium]
MTRETFETYIAHFNNKRYDEISRYLTDDIRVQYVTPFSIGARPGIVRNGKAELRKAYEHLHATVRTALKLKHFICDGKNLYAELWTEYHALEDTPDFSAGPLQKGDVFVATNFLLHWLNKDGAFYDIRVGHHSVHDPSEAFL